MNADTEIFFVSGNAGNLECALDLPKKSQLVLPFLLILIPFMAVP